MAIMRWFLNILGALLGILWRRNKRDTRDFLDTVLVRMRWCKLCRRNVKTVKPFHWWLFILPCFTFIGTLISAGYVTYYLCLKKPQCPICSARGQNLAPPEQAPP